MPALNDLLKPYGIAFGDAVLEGQAAIDGEQIYYASGANVVRFPLGGYLHAQNLADKATTGKDASTSHHLQPAHQQCERQRISHSAAGRKDGGASFCSCCSALSCAATLCIPCTAGA